MHHAIAAEGLRQSGHRHVVPHRLQALPAPRQAIRLHQRQRYGQHEGYPRAPLRHHSLPAGQPQEPARTVDQQEGHLGQHHQQHERKRKAQHPGFVHTEQLQEQQHEQHKRGDA